jgi:uncharacterized repeat protein (TIGR01451 family)
MFNVRLTRWVAATVFATAALVLPQNAQAAGTQANTLVTNTATVDFSVGGVAQPQASGTATFRVDDKVNLTVTNNSGANVVPSSTDQVLAFTVTNNGNNAHGYLLGVSLASGFTMNNVRIYLDNGSTVGSLDGTDTLYSGGNAGDLAPDASMNVLIVSDTPAAAVNGTTSVYNLIATTTNAGTATVTTSASGTPDDKDVVQVVFADVAGTADAVTDGRHSATGTYTVATATVTVTKTSTVVSDPFSGVTNPKRIPGAIVRYSITVNNTGTVAATGVTVRDAIPANTTYRVNTIQLNSVAQTDAADGFPALGGDESDFNVSTASAVTVRLGTSPTFSLAAGGSATITFEVTVN